MGPAVILFDGDCAYCNGWVRWISKRDRKDRFRFEPLTTPQGLAMRKRHAVPEHLDSIVLVVEEQAFTRSDAAWRVLRELQGWNLAAWSLRLVPRPLRNWGYDLIARNRHRLGMKDSCDVPRQ